MLQSILETVPWLLPIASWLAAAIVIWCLASIPALAVRRLTLAAREAFHGLARQFQVFASASQVRRHNELRGSRDAYINGLADRPFDDSIHTQWLRDAIELATPLKQATAVFVDAHEQNNKAVIASGSLKESLENLGSGGGGLPTIPGPNQAAPIEQARSAAMLTLCIGLLLLIPIVLVNAQLTALVLREAIPDIEGLFAAIPPAFAIAVALTIAEAGIGAAHGELSAENEESGRQYTLGLLVLTLLGLLVVLMELLLYSQFREAGGEPFQLPLLGIPVPAGSAFGLIGLILGSAVLILGRMSYRSARTVVVRRSLRSATARYEALRRSAGRLHEAIHSQGTKLAEVHAYVTAFHDQLKERRFLLAAEQFQSSVRAFVGITPTWVSPTTRPLTPAEVLSMESLALFSLVAAGVAVTASGVAFASTVSMISTGGRMVSTAFGALGALALLYAGYTVGASQMGRSQGRRLSIFTTIVSVAALFMAGGYLAARFYSWSFQIVVVAALITAAALLVSIGISLQATGPFVFIFLRLMWIRLTWIPVFILIAALYVLWFLILLVDAAVGLIAQPAQLLLLAFAKPRTAI